MEKRKDAYFKRVFYEDGFKKFTIIRLAKFKIISNGLKTTTKNKQNYYQQIEIPELLPK